MAPTVKTRLLVVSDTHGGSLMSPATAEMPVDVFIHCGDLTEESQLHEFRTTIGLIKAVKAPLTLVIAGNHDWTLDDRIYRSKVAQMNASAEDLKLVAQTYGRQGDARRLLDSARADGIVYMDEGTHTFKLANGALLTVYASPYTPSMNDWGFGYNACLQHYWEIRPGTDIAITHSPPKGMFDYTSDRKRGGSSSLFAAVARARPLLHCFGHIHEGWGGKRVQWIPEPSAVPSHITDIDNDNEGTSRLESLASMRVLKFDDEDTIKEKNAQRQTLQNRGYWEFKESVTPGEQTLFVNAAIEGESDAKPQWPWLIDLQLPRSDGQR